jgi:hypothetical protein
MFAFEVVSLLNGGTDSLGAVVMDVIVGESKGASSLVVVLFKVVVVMFAFEVVSLLDGDTDPSGAEVTDVVVGEIKGASSLAVVLFKVPGVVVVVVVMFAFEVVSLLNGDTDPSGAVVMDDVVGESKGASSLVVVLFKRVPGFVVVVMLVFETVSLLDGDIDSVKAIVMDVVVGSVTSKSSLTR